MRKTCSIRPLSHAGNRKSLVLASAVWCSLFALYSAPAEVSAQATHEAQAWQIRAGSLDSALIQLGEQAGVTISYLPQLVAGKTTGGLSGRYTLREALEQLLTGSGLEFERIDGRTLMVKKAPAGVSRPDPVPQQSSRNLASPNDERVVGMPAIMVKGARTLNIDIERTVDDPQPYIIFDRATIERSGAVNLHDFLSTRLPMNTNIRRSSGGGGSDMGVNSTVDLRGLGETQTLILIDGRRLAKSSTGVTSGQPDINGIPMAAIERIEVLPTTASAIYGGAATGGVINIIMRRDYVGTQVTLNYDNSFDTDSAIKRIDLSSGLSLFGGRTSILLVGSYSESNSMLVRDRKFSQRGRENIKENNPALYYPAFRPLNGDGVNIVSADGSSLLMKNGAPLNSAFTYAPKGYGGIASDGGAALVSNAGSYAPGSIDSVMSPGEELISSPLVKYFSGSIRHEFSGRLSGFLEASRSENTDHLGVTGDYLFVESLLPGSAPTNPFQQDVLVNTSSKQMGGYVSHEAITDRFSGGLVFQLPAQWMAAVDYTYSKAKRGSLNAAPYSNSSILRPAYANGDIDLLRDLDSQDLSSYVLSGFTAIDGPLETTTKNPAVRISGPIGALKAGRPWVSMLLERQNTVFGPSSSYEASRIPPYRLFPERSQAVDSAYLEIKVPLLSSANNIPWIDELELQLAGRWDSYETVSGGFIDYLPPSSPPPFSYVRNEVNEFSPLVAVRFRPNESVAFRASYGEGFMPPDINQLSFPQTTIGYSDRIGSTLLDPRRGNTLVRSYSSEVILTRGGNPNLEPEYSTTKSLGVIYTPRWLDGFRLSIDYTNLRKENNVIALGPYQILLDNEEHFPGRVTRGPDLPTDPEGWAGIITGLDISMANAAQAKLEAYDLQMDYSLYTASKGAFEFYARGTWQTKYDVRLLASAPIEDSLGWVSSLRAPLELKGNLGVMWNFEPWTLGWTMRYASSYYVANPAAASSVPRFLAQGNGGRVPSQTYHDLFVARKFSSNTSGSRVSNLWDGMELQIGVRNVFNKNPPYDFSYNATYYSGIGDPRLATYYITLRQSF